MKSKTSLILMGMMVSIAFISFITQSEPWTKEQLMKPSELAAKLKNSETSTFVIYNIGPSGKIPSSIDIGATQEKENIKKLEKALKLVPKNTEVIIYCGCCPFDNCPNIRPAFQLLKEKGFAKPRLLELNDNLKVDWIDKGYPIQ